MKETKLNMPLLGDEFLNLGTVKTTHGEMNFPADFTPVHPESNETTGV